MSVTLCVATMKSTRKEEENFISAHSAIRGNLNVKAAISRPVLRQSVGALKAEGKHAEWFLVSGQTHARQMGV